MLLVKALAENDAWEVFEAHKHLRYLGNRYFIEIPIFVNDNAYLEHDIGRVTTDQLPPADITHFTCLMNPNDQDVETTKGLFHWVTWRDQFDETHRLVTDGPVYICNERGDTIESLR